ncbi:MAG: orotidine-5'-phosphate decarboxylase [Clostridia bacterium]|nr:orotidine-5'-phosphate decarboxylase [Clostridia bacterium]
MPFDRLIEKITALQNPTVVGLDPSPERIPAFLRDAAYERYGETPEGAAEAVLAFNKGIIDALYDIVPAVKPQCAFYERLGWQGMRALHETIRYARAKGMFVIADGKRNDIGSTMKAYAEAWLGAVCTGGAPYEPFGADALTVGGYLGRDGIAPLLDACKDFDKGIFVLVKTSNPSSGELQDVMTGDGPVYRRMGLLCEQWGACLPGRYGYSAVGAVVGATYPSQLTELRALLPHTFLLVPGYGAQGGSAADAAKAFDQNGLGAIVNSSRAILYAYEKEGCSGRDYAAAARREALRMRSELTAEIGKMKF